MQQNIFRLVLTSAAHKGIWDWWRLLKFYNEIKRLELVPTINTHPAYVVASGWWKAGIEDRHSWFIVYSNGFNCHKALVCCLFNYKSLKKEFQTSAFLCFACASCHLTSLTSPASEAIWLKSKDWAPKRQHPYITLKLSKPKVIAFFFLPHIVCCILSFCPSNLLHSGMALRDTAEENRCGCKWDSACKSESRENGMNLISFGRAIHCLKPVAGNILFLYPRNLL